MTPNPLTNLVPVEITLDDGTKANFQLRQLKIRELYAFMHHLKDGGTPELVEQCYGQSKGWADTLSPEVFGQLSEAAIKLNFPRAAALAQRDPVAAGLLAPLMLDLLKLQQTLQPAINGSALSPASASSPAGDGSAASTNLPAVSTPSSMSTDA
jgi:hypothetical protein